MASRVGRLVVGIGSIVYGATLVGFWVWALCQDVSRSDLPDGVAVAALTVFLIVSVPVALVVTGYALCRSQPRTHAWVGWAAMVTVLLLTAKAILAGAFAYKDYNSTGFLSGILAIILLVFVIGPSVVWALVLGWMAARLGAETPSSGPARQEGGKAGPWGEG